MSASRPVDRREFLRAGGVLGGAAALGGPGARARLGAHLTRAEGPAEVVVIGAGAFGGWTALYLQELGIPTILIDQWGPGNLWSSSGGETRGIRFSYGDREMYTRWAYRALGLWKAWQEEWGTSAGAVYTRAGRLLMQDGPMLRESKAALDRHGVPNELLPQSEVAYRFPQIESRWVDEAIYEPEAGILRCGQACEMVAEAFEARGGRMVIGRARPGTVQGGRLREVVLQSGDRVSAQTFVFACGPWLPKVLPEVMARRMDTPTRYLFYIGTPPDDQSYTARRHPNFSVPGAYGFAALDGDNHGFKIGVGGGEHRDPDVGDRLVPHERIPEVRGMLARWFPGLAEQPILRMSAHHADYTVDSDFIIDTHPELANVWVAGGGSGHGFKHGPAIGEYTAHRIAGNDIDPQMTARFRFKTERFAPQP